MHEAILLVEVVQTFKISSTDVVKPKELATAVER